MRTQTLHEFRPAPVAVLESKPALVRGIVVSISESPAFSVVPDEVPELNRDGLGCLRGLRAAFFLEGGMILLAYAFWHFWHIARW